MHTVILLSECVHICVRPIQDNYSVYTKCTYGAVYFAFTIITQIQDNFEL